MIKKIIFSCLISFSFCANSQYNVTGVPYFYQYSNSINPGGSCQNTSIAMLLKYYGATNLTPDWISNQYGTSQAQTVSGFNTVCNSVAQSKGLAANCISTSSGSFQGMNALLAQGKPVVVHGYFTGYGHVMVVTGFTGTHYICNDPAGKWSQVYQGGYLSSTSTVGNQIQYGKAAFEQAIGPNNTLWYHYYNAPACSTPTGLTTQEITSSSAKMKWLQVGSASSYNVRYRKTGTTTWTTSSTYYNELVANSLQPSSSYEFQVQTICNSQTSNFSTTSSFTTLAPPCGNATGLTTQNITHNSAKFVWSSISGVTSYNVRYRLNGTTNWTSATTNLNELNVSALSASSTYEFQVQSVCGAQNSTFSSSSTFTTLAPPCGIPTGLFSQDITHNSAKMKWPQVTGATSYNVKYRKTGTTTWTTTLTYFNELVVSTLEPLTTYEFQVQTTCETSTSNYSALCTFSTTAIPCSNPTSLSFGNLTSSGATVSWVGGSTATSYNVRYRVTGTTTWTNTTSSTNSKVLSGLTPSTNYECQVQTVCSSVQSSFTSGTFTTLAPQPITVQIGNGTTTYSGHPYSSSFMDERTQYIITKNELVSAGWSAQTPVLQSIAFQVSSSSSTVLNSFVVRISHTTASTYANGTFLAGTTAFSTYTGNITTTNGWNTYAFATPFNYNETMNLVITISFNNSSAGSNSIVLSNILSDYKSLFRRENLASTGIASSSSGTQSYYRPNMRLKFGAQNTSIGKQTEEQKDIELETQVLESKMLYVYPNPMTANTKLQFITDLKSEIGINLSIYDEFGRILYRAENYLLDPFENSINMDSELNQGVYFLNIQSENICLTERFQVIK